MILEVEKKTKEQLVIDTPSFYKSCDVYYFITDQKILMVSHNQITIWESCSAWFGEYAGKAIAGERICEAEFQLVYAKVAGSFDELLTLSEAHK